MLPLPLQGIWYPLSISLSFASTPPHPLTHTPRHTLMACRTLLDPQQGTRASTCVFSTSNQSAHSRSPAGAHSPAIGRQSTIKWKITRAAKDSIMMGSLALPSVHVLSADSQKKATAMCSHVTRKLAKLNPSCGEYPGVTWVNRPDAYKWPMITRHANEFRALLAQHPEFARVQLTHLNCMHFESVNCLDLEQLANNVRIQMLLAIHWLQYTANSFLVFELKQKETDYLFD
jgi:hypothetical protein